MSTVFHLLHSHPDTPGLPPHRVEVTTTWLAQGSLRLQFYLSGITQLRWPAPALARHTDGLWQHTCCEAFIARTAGTDYREFNFSPSGAWAIYDFKAYRERSASAAPTAEPTITQDALSDGRHLLQADIPPPLIPGDATFRLGLTTVLEHPDGSKSYWALHHAGAQPDFHLCDSFCLNLSRP